MKIFVGLMLVAVLLCVRPTTAHLPPGACIDHCLKECKLSGLGIGPCIKYCPVHCLPPDASTKEHYCNLGCMLDECAKFINGMHSLTLSSHFYTTFMYLQIEAKIPCIHRCR